MAHYLQTFYLPNRLQIKVGFRPKWDCFCFSVLFGPPFFPHAISIFGSCPAFLCIKNFKSAIKSREMRGPGGQCGNPVCSMPHEKFPVEHSVFVMFAINCRALIMKPHFIIRGVFSPRAEKGNFENESRTKMPHFELKESYSEETKTR